MDVIGYNRQVVTLQPNSSTAGTTDFSDDHDYFRVPLVAGHNYVINMRGAPSGGGTMTDTLLALRNSGDVSVATDDDGGKGAIRSSRFTPTPPASTGSTGPDSATSPALIRSS